MCFNSIYKKLFVIDFSYVKLLDLEEYYFLRDFLTIFWTENI